MKDTMKAVVKTEAAPGASLEEVPVPSPSPTQALIEVESTSICGSDYHIYAWNEWAQEKDIELPHTMGHELAGRVVETGELVTRISEGDFVSAETHINCGECYQCRTGQRHICQNMEILGVHTDGVFSEYTAIEADMLEINPPGLSPELASLQEPLGNAIDTINAGEPAGNNVLITGAGPVGLMGVLVARALGAATITVTEPHDYRRKLAEELGASWAIEPESLEDHLNQNLRAEGFDLAAEMSGNKAALRQGLEHLTPGGKMAILGAFDGEVSLDINQQVFKNLRVEGITGRKMYRTWYTARRLLREQIIDLKQLVTHEFSLEEFERGMKLMESGDCGKIVLLT